MLGNAKQTKNAVRLHWGIANPVYWRLDVSFNEDVCRIRPGYAAENIPVPRHLAFTLDLEKIAKPGTRGKRLRAG